MTLAARRQVLGKRVYSAGLFIGLAAALPGIDVVRIGPLRIWHVFFLIGFFVAVAGRGDKRLGAYRPGLVDVLFLAYVVLCIIVEFFDSESLRFVPDIANTAVTLFYYLGYVATRVCVQNSLELERFLRGFLVPAIPSALVAVLQMLSPAFALWTVNLASGEGFEGRILGDGLLRAAGLFGHWTGSGLYFCVMLAAGLLLFYIPNREKSGFFPLAVVATALLGIVVTLTISVILTAGTLLFVAALRAKDKVAGVGATVVAALAAVFLFRDGLDSRVQEQAAVGTSSAPSWLPSTLQYRWRVWESQTIPAIAERPLLGWGSHPFPPGESGQIIPRSLIWPSPESQWFHLAVTRGIPIALLFALLMIVVTVGVLRRARTHSFLFPIPVLMLMTWITSITTSAFTNRGMPMALWPLIGAIGFYSFTRSPVEQGIDRAIAETELKK